VTDLTKARLIYLLLIASLFAYFLASVGFGGMSDGGGFH
jgi:heme O synthase-like polyprenyltransferase